MSLGEESELHDLVKQTLEKSGSMSKIRAELRASVFLALDENGCFENLKTKNNHLQELANSSDGALLLCLIREFLDYYGLSFTASVFDPELASYGIECDCKDYMKLGNQLNLSPDYFDKKKGPLLCEMLKIIRNFQNNSQRKHSSRSNPEELVQLHNSKSTDSSTEYYQLQPFSVLHDVSKNKVNQKQKESDVEDGSNLGSKLNSSKFANSSALSPTVFGRESDSSKHSQSSLGDLPPLTPPQSIPSKNILSPSNNSSKQLHKFKAMLLDASFSDNNEDLSIPSMVTDDEKENEKKIFDDISEIEDDLPRN